MALSTACTSDSISTVLPLVVIDVHTEAEKTPDYTLPLERVKKWESEHGPIPKGAFVAMRTDWSKRTDPVAYQNFDETGQHAVHPLIAVGDAAGRLHPRARLVIGAKRPGPRLVQQLLLGRAVGTGAAGRLGEHPVAGGSGQGVDLEVGLLVGGGDAGKPSRCPMEGPSHNTLTPAVVQVDFGHGLWTCPGPSRGGRGGCR
jgi:hypothetical protein